MQSLRQKPLYVEQNYIYYILRNVHNAIFETKTTLCRTKLYILYFEKRS